MNAIVKSRKINAHKYAELLALPKSIETETENERALEIVEAAAKTGAHALKIQTYTPDAMK